MADVKYDEHKQSKWVLVGWIACFGMLIILSFFIFVPVAVTMENAGNSCFLYADENGFGALSVCSYCVASAIIFLCICGIRLVVLVIKVTQYTCKLTDQVYSWINVWGIHLFIFILDVLLVVLLLVTACLISVGLSEICTDLFGNREKCSSDGVDLPNGKTDTTFYKALSFSEGSAWFTFCFWLLVVWGEVFMMWRNGFLSKLTQQMRNIFRGNKGQTNQGGAATQVSLDKY
ncbi:uncharacterized protein LOC131957390 [Physella acuta]|uniref:uncharacterized protein LOC131957390 n=1 Tax=Physella acuta TaxID=109671 RepID=UPI0027DE33BF|nr:uncharacterized protein LOC131957390 [Physella acuta]